jgi:hypothetical protein
MINWKLLFWVSNNDSILVRPCDPLAPRLCGQTLTIDISLYQAQLSYF